MYTFAEYFGCAQAESYAGASADDGLMGGTATFDVLEAGTRDGLEFAFHKRDVLFYSDD